MSKAKTKLKMDFKLDEFMTDAVAKELGEAVNQEVQDLISNGISPVRGDRRYERYKDPKTYPGKRKPARPVNLYLSGEMLGSLRFRRKGANSLEYGFLPGTSSDVLTRARAHQEGTETLPARPILPIQGGQEWAVSVVRAIKEVYSRRLEAMLKKSNR